MNKTNKYTVSSFAFLFFYALFAADSTAKFDKTYYQEESKKLICFKADGTPKASFLGLIKTLRLRDRTSEQVLVHDGTRKSVVDLTQKAFFHKNTECYQIKNNSYYSLKTVQPLLEKLELLREYNPPQNQYESAVFLDGTLLWDRERQRKLIEIWKAGTRFKNIHVCTGDHLFDPDCLYRRRDFFELEKYDLKKNKHFNEALYDPISQTDEYVLHMLFGQVAMPDELSQLDEHWVVSKTDPVTGARPNTMSNARDFLACNCKPQGKHVVISNGPHVPYQKTVFLYEMLMAKNSTVKIDVVGCKDPGEFNSMQHLDRLARLAYAENLLLNELGVDA